MDDESDYYAGAAFGMQNLYAGTQFGAQNLVHGAQYGMGRMMADIGSLMPPIAAPQMHDPIHVRHGLYAHEMSLSGSIGSMFHMGIPETTTAYEYREMAGRDLGQRFGGAAAMGTLYGTAAMAGWYGGGALMTRGFKAGKNLGKGIFLSQMGYGAGQQGLRQLAATGGTMGKMGFRAAGIAGGIVGALPAMAAFEALTSYTGAIAEDIMDRQETMNFLEASSFRYAPASGADIDPRFGGFNRQARSRIAESIKQIDYSDSRYDMKDLKMVLEGGTELGLFSGTRDAEDFGKKFKELTTTLKQVTTTLHQSLGEGLQTIKQLKDMGFRTPETMSSAIMTADVLGSASGKTAAEMLSLGMQGSQMVRGTGMTMASGAQMMMQNMAQVSQMYSSGTLSSETIAQAGGQQALAQQMMASNINFMRSDLGRGVLTSIMGAGGATLDPSALNRLASGDMTLGQMVNMGAGKINSPGDYINAYVNQGKRMRELSEQFGGQGVEIAAMGTNVAAARSLVQSGAVGDMETAFRYQMKSSGFTDEVIEAQIGKLRDVDKFRANQQTIAQQQASKATGEIVRRRTDIIGRTGDALYEVFVGTPASMVSDIYNAVGTGIEQSFTSLNEKIDRNIFGVEKVELSNIKTQDIARILKQSSDVPKLAIRAELATMNFTDEETKAFEGGASYKKLEGKYGYAAISSSAQRASSLDQYAKEVFGSSKSWQDLSKEEKMFAESNIMRTNPHLKGVLDSDQETARGKIEQQRLDYIRGSDQKRAEAKQNLAEVVHGIARNFGVDKYNDENSSELRQAVVRAAETEEGGKTLQKLLDSKATTEDIRAQLNNSVMPLDKEGREKLQKQLAESEANSLTLGKKFADEASKQGYFGKEAARMFLSGIRDAKVGESAKKFSDAHGEVEKAMGSKEYRQIIATTDKAIESQMTVGMRKLEKSGDREDYAELVEKFKKSVAGEGSMSASEYEELGELSTKAGMGSMAMIGRLGESVSGKAMISTEDAVKKFSMAGISVTKEEIKDLADKSGNVSTKDLMRFATVREMSQKGGTTVFGAGTTEQVKKEEADVIATLVQVQSQAEAIAHRYEILAQRLGIK